MFSLSLPLSVSLLIGLVNTATIYSPPSSYIVPRTLYARSLLLSDNKTLLATWENYSPEPPLVWFPVFRSTDFGSTWAPLSNVTDTQNGWGLRYQPTLFELPQAIGTYPQGTILCAGNSIPTNLSNTQIDVYASLDKGASWEFVSHVAAGGEAEPTNGLTPVWEPFMNVYDDQLVIYYSDQRDPLYGQKLVHQVTNDLLTWGAVVNDVAYSTYAARPGMPTIAHLPDGNYLMTYEYCNSPEGGCTIYYRTSASPLTFDAATGVRIVATTGEAPSSSPSVIWTPYGGTNGTIIVSANSHAGVFLNKANAVSGSAWTYLTTTAARAYSRDIDVMTNSSQILITGGGSLGGSTNSVTSFILQL